MRFESPFPLIYTENVAALAAFYSRAFGFTVAFEFPDETGAAAFVQLTLGECALGLGRPIEPAHGGPVTASSRPATFELCLRTDDVDGAVARLRDQGAPVLREPENMPWNERMAYVADPDGHPIMLYAPPPHPLTCS